MATPFFTAAALVAVSSLITIGVTPLAPGWTPEPPAVARVPAGSAARPVTMPAAAFVDAHSSYTVVLTRGGRLYGTGRNDWRQQTGTEFRRLGLTAMTPLPGGVAVERVSAGDQATLAIGENGAAYAAGGSGLFGLNTDRFQPVTGLPEGVSVLRVAGGSYFNLLIGSDGVAYGIGNNDRGQLTGKGSKNGLNPLIGLPVGVRAKDVVAGGGYSLVLGSDGNAYGTGGNAGRQLTGDERIVRELTRLRGLPAGVRASQLAAGRWHSLVLGDNGQVYGAGRTFEGQLTRASNKPRTTLTRLVGLPAGVNARGVAAGSLHSVVLGDDNVVYGTGFNRFGQLSGTARRDVLTPIKGLPTDERPVQVAAGSFTTIVRTAGGNVYGTGSNEQGALTGNDDPRRVLRPLAIWRMGPIRRPAVVGSPNAGSPLQADPGAWIPAPVSLRYQWMRSGRPITGATGSSYKVAAADLFSTLAVRVTAARPGYRAVSQTSHARLVTPDEAPHHVTATDIGYGSLVLATDGRVYSTGGGRTALSVLDAIPGGEITTHLVSDGSHLLLLGGNGEVYGLGSGDAGQLTGDNSERRTPTLLTGLPAGARALDIAVGDEFSAVAGDDGRIYGTGRGLITNINGGLVTARTLTAMPALPSGSVVAVHGSGARLIALASDGIAYRWARDTQGVLGWQQPTGLPEGVKVTSLPSGHGQERVVASDGNMYLLTNSGESWKRVALPGSGSVMQVSIDGRSFVYIDDRGVPRGQGGNAHGEFTAPDLAVTSPVVLSGLPSGVRAAEVAAGVHHTLVVGDDGVVYGTGSNSEGDITGIDRAARWGLQPLIWTLRPFTRPRITGTLEVGRFLTATDGTWWPEPTSLAYQWFRDGNTIPGAVAGTYRLTRSDRYAEISVSVTARRAGHRPRAVTVTTNDIVRPAG